MLLSNAFSINMLSQSSSYTFSQVSLEDAREMLDEEGFTSAVGHADTARLFSTLLGREVPCNRVSISDPKEMLIGQYSGPRLPEGCSTLPEGSKIVWWYVRAVDWDRVQNYYEGRTGSF